MLDASDPQYVQVQADGESAVRLALKVVPGSRQDKVVGPHGGALKVMVSPPPEGGAANRAVCRLVADFFGLPAKRVEIVQGQSSQWKTVRLEGLSLASARQRLEERHP